QLQKAGRNSPALQRGSNGPGVAELQSLLADMGFGLDLSLRKGRPDGVYGAETDRAIKDFQRRRGLVADGVAGRDTIGALDEIVASNSMLESPGPGSESAELSRDLATPISRSKSAYW
ncbi:MAG: peptidoglycan-binding protein, partial [Pseudaminobacter sp.]|nr:peptidoglycan-binding protein [Pseudaminobacter sp.]